MIIFPEDLALFSLHYPLGEKPDPVQATPPTSADRGGSDIEANAAEAGERKDPVAPEEERSPRDSSGPKGPSYEE